MFETYKFSCGGGALCVVLMMVGCNNDDVPEWDPDGMEAGETGIPTPVGCWELEGDELVDPTLFQCVGEAEGELKFFACKALGGCTGSVAGVCNYANAAEWTVDSVTAGPYPFPPTPPNTEPNSRVCCETATALGDAQDACAIDCARAACTEALDALKFELADHLANPEFGCGVDPCKSRVETGLTLWINHLEANYDECVNKALDNLPFVFPNPDVEAGLGALACARLQINCVLDDETEPYDLNQTCATSENEPLEVLTPVRIRAYSPTKTNADGLEARRMIAVDSEAVSMVSRESAESVSLRLRARRRAATRAALRRSLLGLPGSV